MAGIYIHVPFCKQACHYCNFHFSTSLKYKDDLIHALLNEIALRRDYLPDTHLQSIYFGGGTPSLLTREDLEKIFDQLSKYFSWTDQTEITLEANPDDLSEAYLNELATTPINRLSIGIQSFFDDDLSFMNRAHNAAEAEKCIQMAQDVGIINLSCDLIYGSETTSDEMLLDNVQKLIDYQVPHVSAYCLTIEENTALHHFVNTGKAKPTNEEKATRQFHLLLNALRKGNYQHYEISNYALEGHEAIHNSNYWEGQAYLGLGPSAHSFDGKQTRAWNIPHNAKYIAELMKGQLPIEEEKLSMQDQYNEYVLTRLRTRMGIDIEYVQRRFVDYAEHLVESIQPHLNHGAVYHKGNSYILTDEGKMLADGIASSLFMIED